MKPDDFSQENVSCTAFFTGHRHMPEKDRPWIEERLYQALVRSYAAGYRRFICGCALGFDMLAAFTTLRFRESHPDVILSLAIPCTEQNKYWQEKDREDYNRMIALADEINVISPVYYQGVMLARNRYMADRSSLCICYLTHMNGGTASAVRYALIHDRIRIVNLAVRSVQAKDDILRENTWNCTFISPSVSKNAGTAPLCLLTQKKLTMKHISGSF